MPVHPAADYRRSSGRPTRSRIAVALIALIVAALAIGLVPAADASIGTIVAQPNTAPTSIENADYARLVRLDHSGDTSKRGTLLTLYSVNDDGTRSHFAIKKSTDAGATWTTISTIYSPTAGWGIYTGTLYELPQATGGLPAGTLFAAGTAWVSNDWTAQEIQTFVSTDYGVTWTRKSNCATKSGAPNIGSTGLWEPEFIVNANGSLACHYSDERQAAAGYHQLLAMVTSTDGGTTWSSATNTVAIQDSSSRPGMAIVRKLPNGSYVLGFEDCVVAIGNSDQTCRVYLKTSTDGASWTPASSLGTLVATADGRQLLHTPGLTWAPGGGPNGTLIMAGQRVVTGTDGPSTVVVPESGRVVFINTNLGVGPWQEVSAPLTVDLTGQYSGGGQPCPNYSPSLLATGTGNALQMVTPRYLAGATNRCEVRFAAGTIGSLPLYAPFDGGTDTGWSTYGGTWTVSGGIYTQSSTVAGPKSLVGSTGWTDYTADTDLRLNGVGQAGVLVRASQPAIGADSHRGYYIGVESGTGTLIIGKQNNSYTGLALVNVTGGISTGTWYHLQVRVIGCTIVATVKPANSTTSTSASATDAGCFASGQVGLRTHLTNASFRNVSVVPAGTSTAGGFVDSWASGSAAGWTSYGGTWSTTAATAVESQTGTGADGPKNVLGGLTGDNYTVSADVDLTALTAGNGNAGVIGRVSSPSAGVDAYNGYFAGVDGTTGQLALGRANMSWVPLASAPVPGSVALNQWYHVTLRASGCGITATAQSTSSWDQAKVNVTDAGCLTSGAVGLRAFVAKAGWRNFTVGVG